MAEEQMMSNTTKGIIAVFVILIVGIFAFYAYNLVYASFNDFDGLKESQKQLIIANFDNFASVSQQCRQVKDDRCICKDAMKNFPNTFPKEFSIEILQDVKATIIPKYNNIALEGKNKIIEMAGFSTAKKSGNTAEEISRVNLLSIILTFKDKPKFNNNYIISGNLYKGASSPSTSYFIIFKDGEPETSQKNFFSQFPACMDNRKEAISKFDAFILSLATQASIKVGMPEHYKIFYGGKIIKLDYKGNDVEKYNEASKTLEIVRNEFLFNVKCSDFAAPDYLEKGDKIKVTKTGNQFCIEKESVA